MKRFFSFHIIPFVVAAVIAYFLISTIQYFSKNFNNSSQNILITEDIQQPSFKYFANYETDGEQKIIFLAKSLSDKTVVLVGSSELTGSSEKLPFLFFNDSILKLIAVGHAYNETFAIYCQLLAMGDYLRNSNVCFILSPGWFEDGKGTNIQAFLEFVPEILQKRIYANNIDEEFKNYFYSYMFKNKIEINNVPLTYSLLANLSSDNNFPIANKLFANKFLPQKVDFKFSISDTISPCKNSFTLSWDSMLTKDYEKFLTTCTSNKIYVYNEYYFEHLVNKDGTVKSSTVSTVLFPNTELEDLKMLLKLLKYYNCNASFIMQQLNPYYYHSLENYTPIMDSIQKLIVNENHYPYFNMFVTDTANYHAGDLRDVMHIGNAGWDKVNRFIYETYCNKSLQK